jgi:hypothetical protein
LIVSMMVMRMASEITDKAKVVFTFRVESVRLKSDADDLKYGYNDWLLAGVVIDVIKGSLMKGMAYPEFEAEIRLWEGPPRVKPKEFWNGRMPSAGQIITAFCDSQGTPEELLGGYSDHCIELREGGVHE